MIIDDAYAGMKDKYFEKAQTKTGVLSGVVKGLNDFVKKYDSAKQTMNSDMQELKQTYVYNSAPFELKHMEIFNTFNETVAKIREESKTQIQDVIQKVRDKVSEIITSPLPEGGMDDINMIRSFAGKLSDDEIKAFLNKYKNCYLATKTIFEAMEEGQDDRLGVEFVTVKNITDSIDSIEEMAMNMIRTYNGDMPYDVAVMLDGSEVQTVNDAFESFVSTYEG
ncbi:MAG: hypothetical protein SOR66_00620 [Mediterraneibacter faecis]|nr:hypothetical protein [Mediterraneibacter faecis]